jgi:glycosyltransferase 2 family protein
VTTEPIVADPTAHALVRRRADAIAIGVGLAVVVVTMFAAADGAVAAWERDVFHALNDLPDWLSPFVWPFTQAGAIGAGAVVAAVGFAMRRPRIGVAGLVALVGKVATEKTVKAFVTRERPGTTIAEHHEVVNIRGDVHLDGKSFPSGHVLMAAALVVMLIPHIPRRWRWVPIAVGAMVPLARIYVGAHNPLDVVCGAALGVALGSAYNLVARVPKGDG